MVTGVSGFIGSPYAITKRVIEMYTDIFSRCYDFPCVGLRYFNVFGRRQDPKGAYAAVIPKWAAAMISDKPVYINGDGETSRDFCSNTNFRRLIKSGIIPIPRPTNE